MSSFQVLPLVHLDIIQHKGIVRNPHMHNLNVLIGKHVPGGAASPYAAHVRS